jgi:hypothetical protein
VFDCTRVNGWHLERMRVKARKLFTVIQRYITTREEFDNLLKNKLP